VNGQRADANYFTVDGVSANFGVNGSAPLAQTAGGARFSIKRLLLLRRVGSKAI
jgi:hypothetical protein